MSEALSSSVPSSAGTSPVSSLRAQIAERAAQHRQFSLSEVVSWIVPLCRDVAARHEHGEAFFLHPSSVVIGPDGSARILAELASAKPTDSRDLAAIAPEVLQGGVASPRASIFSLGAILYELLTGNSVGPSMKPPTALVPGLPALADTILAKALTTDPSERPGDFAAFAQAVHHLAPRSMAPPPAPADDSASFEIELDLRSSMLPPPGPSLKLPVREAAKPAPARRASEDPFGAVVLAEPVAAGPKPQAVEELNALKMRLEADRTPRWIVVKDKMDHGPFAGIELLQQIVSNTFSPTDELVDSVSGFRYPIKDHPEFSRFAHHAHLKREQVKEAKAVVALDAKEKTQGTAKNVIGIIVVLAVLGGVAFLVISIQRGREEDAARKRQEESVSVIGEGAVSGSKKAEAPKKTAGGGGGGGGGPSWGGKSYNDALKGAVSDMDAEKLMPKECGVTGQVAADCGLSGSAHADYVVQHGRCLGVSVTTDPPQPGVAACMAGRIGRSSWKSVGGVAACGQSFKVK